jgi:RNA 3'-terminal phosphate cyclase (ATP)
MIYIDGSEKSGSGTILRSTIALASVLGRPFRMTGIRARRAKPGLRPQHLACVTACAEMCGAEVQGAAVNSMQIVYKPGTKVRGGHYEWNIGTAGSTTLLASALVPLAMFADTATAITLTGGLFQDFAPSAHHMQHVLLPTLRKMGIDVDLEILQPGYVPAGRGKIRLNLHPVTGPIKPLILSEQGEVRRIGGLALSSRLKTQRVSERMASECKKVLAGMGLAAVIEERHDETSPQPGASLTIWAETENGCLIGSDQAGKRGRTSESIGRYVAKKLKQDLDTGATVDRYLADQLIVYAALAGGTTRYVIPQVSDHVEANLWLAEKWGASTGLEGSRLTVTGLGYARNPRPA